METAAWQEAETMTPNPEQSDRLLALAERVERHSFDGRWDIINDRNRELNEAIAAAAGIPLTVKVGDPALGNDRRVPAFLKAYVTSLDAAMTLIPADLLPTIDFVTNRVWIRDAKGFDVAWGSAHGFAATVPLSICAAALRARAGDGA